MLYTELDTDLTVIYSTILVLTILIERKKKDKVALNGNKTQFNHENSFHIETKIEFKIRLLVEIKNIHIYIYTHKVQTSSGTEDAFAAHANLLSTACIPWMRVLQ